MEIRLEGVVRPLIQFALCRDSAQLPLWDTKLDYRWSPIPDRLLAYGVAISEEGRYICAEICPFESHPLIRQLLMSWNLVRSRRKRRRRLEGWTDREEADRIDRSLCLLSKRLSQSRLRDALSEIWSATLPVITMYSIDGERTWKPVAQSREKWPESLRKRFSGQKTIDPGDTCLMLSDRIHAPNETDRKLWLRQRLNDRVNDCSIYTPGHPAYSRT